MIMDNVCQNCSSCQNKDAMMTKIEKVVSEADDLVTALEHVGAMYGIPSSNIITDDTAKSIRIIDDNIIAPSKPACGNTKSIVCAISAVLDYISQRVDDKLTEFQMNNIEKGNIDIPITNNEEPENSGYSYFSEEEDDISHGVNMNASSKTTAGLLEIPEMDISKEIQESAFHMDLINKYHDTLHLGYDIFNSIGFDYVKPVDSFVQESVANKKKTGKDINITSSDVKYLKFDNKGILDAIKYFNKAAKNQDYYDGKSLDKHKFIHDPNYEKGISALNKQFDCRINLRFLEAGESEKEKQNSTNAFTFIMDEVKKNITVSKSKGFQLNGLPIDIMVINDMFELSTPREIDLFGQNMVSTILHEIAHNISYAIQFAICKDKLSLEMALNIAANCNTIHERRIVLTNYVNSIYDKNNVISKIAKKKLVKQLLMLTSVEKSKEGLEKITDIMKDEDRNKSADEYADNLVKRYKKLIKTYSKHDWQWYLGIAVAFSFGCILETFSMPMSIIVKALSAGVFGYSLGHDTGVSVIKISSCKNELDREEYYADLFAGMYQLPVIFFINPLKKGKYTANEVSQTKLNELVKIEKEAMKILCINYPSSTERTYASVKIAKKMLKTEGLDQATKQYCQWIVDNFSNIQKTDIKEMSADKVFDPKEAENLDRHLEKFINDNNITVTESFKRWFYSDEIILND